jgi:hypothetical protein
MSFLDDHRRAAAEEQEILLLKPPFSFFDFIETRFGDFDSIRRVFSLARSFNSESLIVESLSPIGIIAEENEDIRARYSDHRNPDLLRLSFWKKAISDKDLSSLTSEDLFGYAIFKHDSVASIGYDAWHIFEAVFAKYPHVHNCVPRPGIYRFSVGNSHLEIEGVLYCQQNGLNKACAQVALRSLLSRVLPERDISYRRINIIADRANPGFDPGQGLNVQQMRYIFNELGMLFNDVDYCQGDERLRQELPYQKYAYAGLESGYGALVGFRLAGRELQGEAKHIIPFYGHTFNKDTWVPNADISYFRIGEGVGYVPSESWTSSFIGHDDNFGPNFCIPRLYIESDKVDYVVELIRPGVCYSGIQAEAIALNILYSILPSLDGSKNKWISRLIQWTSKQQIVFRAQSVSSTEYASHLHALVDWEGKGEKSGLSELFKKEMPPFVWAVEISTPQLFPANERKLGEIVLDATQPLSLQDEIAIFDIFILARLPGIYLFGGDISNGTPQFTPLQSDIESHTNLIKL